jgi:preprotein translocase subunit SecB
MEKQTYFQFIQFVVKYFEISNDLKSPLSQQLKCGIRPAGIVNKKDQSFQLTLFVDISDELSGFHVSLETVGFFKFEGDLIELRPFLSLNAPALMFPHIRAFVSAVTAMSGLDTVTLPTMNLTSLKSQIEENTELIE